MVDGNLVLSIKKNLKAQKNTPNFFRGIFGLKDHFPFGVILHAPSAAAPIQVNIMMTSIILLKEQ